MHAFVRVSLHGKYHQATHTLQSWPHPIFSCVVLWKTTCNDSIRWILTKLLNTACWWLQRKNSNIYHARTHVLFRGRWRLFTTKENIFKNNHVFSNAVWNLQCWHPVVLVSEQKKCTAVLTEKNPFKCLHT